MLLGDDIVNMDKAVASSYLSIMKSLDVDINQTKSLKSNIGFFEFAKRFGNFEYESQGLPLALLQAARNSTSILIQ
jgi:hypothetical protein